MLFIQNHQRDEYHRMVLSAGIKIAMEKETKEQFKNYSPTSEESDSWDTDLLGLDLRPLSADPVEGEDITFEQLVEDILSDDSRDSAFDFLDERGIATTSDFRFNSSLLGRVHPALIVSHPHGGCKQLSYGKLYECPATPEKSFHDVPTCFGCCGAPVLSFSNNGDMFVTTFVHNGTTRTGDNGSVKGYGLSFFPQFANDLSHCVSV